MIDDHDHPPRDDSDREKEKKRLSDHVVPELLRRLLERAVESGVEKLESGVERLQEGPENLRNFVGELRLPKDVLQYLYNQIDDTKVGLYRVAAKEIRDVIEHTQFAEEITKILTKLSFEIKTEIRFVPNRAREGGEDDDEDDDGTEGRTGLPKPEVKAQVSVKDRSKEPRRERRRREEP